MIWHVEVNLNEVVAFGREYPWQRPRECLRCKRFGVWGHGFVGRYFDGHEGQVLLRCFRCPGCGCVITPRPLGYFRRIRGSVSAIRRELEHRLERARWLPASTDSPSRPRLRHWLRHLRRQALAWLGWTEAAQLLAAFDRLLEAGVIPVGRAIQRGDEIGSSPPQ